MATMDISVTTPTITHNFLSSTGQSSPIIIINQQQIIWCSTKNTTSKLKDENINYAGTALKTKDNIPRTNYYPRAQVEYKMHT